MFFLALLHRAVMFECERGYIGEIIWGRRKPRTDVSGADTEEIKKRKYIVSCSRCKSMKPCETVLCVFIILV